MELSWLVLNKFVVIFMRTNPKPIDEIIFNESQSSIVNTYANRIDFRLVLNFLKVQRRMGGIFNPELIRFASEIFYRFGNFNKKFFKTFGSSRLQRLSNPPSSNFPDSISAKADAAKFLSLTDELEKACSHAFSARISSIINDAIQFWTSVDSREILSIAFSKRVVITRTVDLKRKPVKRKNPSIISSHPTANNLGRAEFLLGKLVGIRASNSPHFWD